MSHTHRHHLSHRPPTTGSGHTSYLDVILVISNPVRFASRYELYKNCIEHLKQQHNVRIHTVEMAFGRRPFEITNECDTQLRSYDQLWHKENMINIGVSRLPPDWKYLAWVDADIEFQRKDWATETLQQLQHYMVVQMFQQAIDLGPNGEAFQIHQGFVSQYLKGAPRPKPGKYTHWHPGYAWAMRREAFEYLGGLYDVSILGSGDHLMAWSLLGEGLKQLPSTMSEGYRKSLSDWEGRATRFIHRDIGFVPGTLTHYFHGKKADRRYRDRWGILERAQFDPSLDLKRDWQGLYQLDMDGSDRMIRFRDEMRSYYLARNEDSIDLD